MVKDMFQTVKRSKENESIGMKFTFKGITRQSLVFAIALLSMKAMRLSHDGGQAEV